MRFLTTFLMAAIATGAICLTPAQELDAQQETATEMAKKLPGSVNSVLTINVDRIKSSALSAREGWVDTHAGQVASGLIFVPPSAKEVVMGAVMDYDSFHPRQTAVLVNMEKVPDLEVIRKATDGTMDAMLGYSFVETASDRYVVPLSETEVAGLRPALRPFFGNWLSSLKEKKPTELSDYLKKGISYADELGTEIILAFDMKHSISRSRVMDRIRDNEIIRENGLDAKEVSRLLASAQGFTLGVTVRDKVYGAIKFEFDEDISSLKPIANDVATAVLNRAGFHLDDIEGWKLSTTSNSIKLAGDMSVQSLRKILAVVDAPQGNTMASTGSGGESEGYGPAVANKRYFDTVNSLLKGVEPKMSAGQAYMKNANWLKQYADKIGALGTLDVDPEMVAYGNYVTQSLRDAQMLLVETNESSREKNRNLIAAGAKSGGAGGRGGWGHSYNRYGWYGGGSGYVRRYSGGDGSRLRSAARQNSKGEAIKSVNEIFTQMSAAQDQVRQQFTSKYNTQF